MQSWVTWAQQHGGTGAQITLGGHPAVVWWDEEAPAEPGCASGCGGDPGPDYVVIGLAAYLGDIPSGGLGVVQIRGFSPGSTRSLGHLCDMEAMVLGVTFAH